MINEGATQEVIGMRLDVKGDTRTEPASTRVLNFGFSFTCTDSSNGGGPQAVSELWMCVGTITFKCCMINCIQACFNGEHRTLVSGNHVTLMIQQYLQIA